MFRHVRILPFFPLFSYYLFLYLPRLLFNALSSWLVSYLSSYKHRLVWKDTSVKLVSRALYTVLMVLVFITRRMKADFMREYYDFWPLDKFQLADKGRLAKRSVAKFSNDFNEPKNYNKFLCLFSLRSNVYNNNTDSHTVHK